MDTIFTQNTINGGSLIVGPSSPSSGSNIFPPIANICGGGIPLGGYEYEYKYEYPYGGPWVQPPNTDNTALCVTLIAERTALDEENKKLRAELEEVKVVLDEENKKLRAELKKAEALIESYKSRLPVKSGWKHA